MIRLTLLLLLLFAGCKQAPPPAPPPPDIGQLQSQHRYVTALAALDDTAKTMPDYETRRAQLLEAAGAYQTQLLLELGELVQQHRFTDAQQRLAEQRAELPPADELDRFATNLDNAATRYRQRSLDDIVQLRGAQLLKEQPLYRALEKAANSSELEQLIARNRADTEFFAAHLAQLGARALAQNEFTKATQYLGQSNQLVPSEAVAEQLKRAEQGLATSKQKRQTARSTEREQHYRERSAALQQNMQQGDYVAARAELEQLKSLNLRTEEVEQTQEQLEKAIATFVAQQVDAGNRLYSDGHLEDALRHWRRAAALAPSPQLTERIEKAQKFIDRFEQLRAKQY
jgi:tetratricopeptide (TPR) repeat protein